MKGWKHNPDRILSTLATNMLDRRLFRVEVHETPVPKERIDELLTQIATAFNISKSDAHYLMSLNTIQKDMYSTDDDSIDILLKDGTIRPIADVSEILNVELLSKKVRKYYLCYQRV